MQTVAKFQQALLLILLGPSFSFKPVHLRHSTPTQALLSAASVRKICAALKEKKEFNMSSEDNINSERPIAGSFFNQVPSAPDENTINGSNTNNVVDPSLARIIDEKIPVAKVTGFGSKLPSTQNNNNANILTSMIKKKREIQQQQGRKNDINNLQYDDQGYTLYANEDTGEKSRVFDALVQYPCDFDIKIVGAADGTFVMEMIQLVAASCKFFRFL